MRGNATGHRWRRAQTQIVPPPQRISKSTPAIGSSSSVDYDRGLRLCVLTAVTAQTIWPLPFYPIRHLCAYWSCGITPMLGKFHFSFEVILTVFFFSLNLFLFEQEIYFLYIWFAYARHFLKLGVSNTIFRIMHFNLLLN